MNDGDERRRLTTASPARMPVPTSATALCTSPKHRRNGARAGTVRLCGRTRANCLARFSVVVDRAVLTRHPRAGACCEFWPTATAGRGLGRAAASVRPTCGLLAAAALHRARARSGAKYRLIIPIMNTAAVSAAPWACRRRRTARAHRVRCCGPRAARPPVPATGGSAVGTAPASAGLDAPAAAERAACGAALRTCFGSSSRALPKRGRFVQTRCGVVRCLGPGAGANPTDRRFCARARVTLAVPR